VLLAQVCLLAQVRLLAIAIGFEPSATGTGEGFPASATVAGGLSCANNHGKSWNGRRLVPVSEVRDTSQHALTRTSETKGTSNSMILVPLFDLKFLTEFAAGGVGTSNRRH